MCKEFRFHNLPVWLVEAIYSAPFMYHLTELFILHCEPKTMEKYYEMLCKELIEKTKTLFERMLKQKLLEINSKIDSFEREIK